MSNTKEIQRRIKSVTSTGKITKAMEMVSAAKMRRAVEAVLKTRSYANLSWTTILNLTKSPNYHELHPLLSPRAEVKKVAIIMFAANRGLCGSFNSALLNKIQDSINKHQTNSLGEPLEHEFIVFGKKGLAVGSRLGHKIIADFIKNDANARVADISPMAKMATADFLAGRYDKVLVAYTDFVNAAVQVPRIKQLLPIDLDAQDDHLGVVGKNAKVGLDKEYIKGKETKYLKDEAGLTYDFTYEPGPAEVLDKMIPRLLEAQLFQALLESNASEHSSRMATMHQANESAKDLVNELTLYYNKVRQAGITSEIAEIAAGANALK
jgi:F-type H+-transporting ATPase subunit gamma